MDHFESYLCQFLLVFFVVVVFIQIILRFLDASLPWTEEIARFAFIWFILFGACYATPALDWDMGYIYLVFPLSFTLMAIRILQVNYIKFVLKQEIADPDQEAVKQSQSALLEEGGKEGGAA